MTAPPSTQGEILFLMGVDLLQEGPFRQYEISSGLNEREPETFFTELMEPDAVLLTAPFAARHRIQIGDAISVRDGKRLLSLRVVGLLKGRGLAEAEGGNIAVMDIASAQWLLGKLGKLDRIDLITDGLENGAATSEQTPLSEIIPSLAERIGPGFRCAVPSGGASRWRRCSSPFS
ncbi:MAG: hypothetical protein MPW14_21440 [Candidatus Manganitrophus sp.]|nr:MAG: hypothetical protein MPW14_21440 [Candidatus Manganitrophus sp.]